MVELDHLKPRDENILPELSELFELDDEGFRKRFRKSPIKRPGRAGLLRNVAIAMGNSGNGKYIPLLTKALGDPEPLVRGHAAWALARLCPDGQKGEITERLSYHSQHESDGEAGTEFHLALKEIGELDS